MSWASFMSGSPMTRRTAGVAANGVFLDQPRADHRLRHRRLVSHREDLAARPYVVLGVAMAIDAPVHLQGVLLECQRHLVDAAVARLAPHPLLHVDAVV